mgnify:CR=1 FL=1
MTDQDNRNEVTIHKSKMGMYDNEDCNITLKSNNDSIDDLIKKAKEAMK